jgi:hypothetical protein
MIVSQVVDVVVAILEEGGRPVRPESSSCCLTKSKQITDYTDTNLILDSDGSMSTSEDLAHWDTPSSSTTPRRGTGSTKNQDRDDEIDDHNNPPEEEGKFQGGATDSSFLPPIIDRR